MIKTVREYSGFSAWNTSQVHSLEGSRVLAWHYWVLRLWEMPADALLAIASVGGVGSAVPAESSCRGPREGEAEMLLRLRFGPLSTAVTERVTVADAETLLR
jgi:hypothetical protein